MTTVVENEEISERVIEALQQISDENEALSFKELMDRVTHPGECRNCLAGPVRKVLHKLIDSNKVYMSFNES